MRRVRVSPEPPKVLGWYATITSHHLDLQVYMQTAYCFEPILSKKIHVFYCS